MPRQETRKSIEKKLDKLWSTVGKSHAQCEICLTLPYELQKKYTQLHPHHIIGRASRATRWDLKNRLWVCPSHHTLGKPNETVQSNLGGWFINWYSDDDWMSKHRPDDKIHLQNLHNAIKKWTLEELQELLRELKEENAKEDTEYF